MSKLHICYCTDSYFVPWTQRSMYDIIIRKNPETEIKFYILLNKIESCDAFEKFKEIEGIEVVTSFHDTDKIFTGAIPDMSWWHKNGFAFLRMIIPTLDIFEGINRVLYIDVDTLARRDLTDLYNVGLDDKILGYTKESMALSFNMVHPYLDAMRNTGVIVMDLEKMRNFNFTEKCIEMCRIKSAEYRVIPAVVDQYAKHLDPKYNIPYADVVHGSDYFKDINNWNIFHKTNYTSLNELIDESYIWHFLGNSKWPMWDDIKRILNESVVRTDLFLETGKVMNWKKEDDLMFYDIK